MSARRSIRTAYSSFMWFSIGAPSIFFLLPEQPELPRIARGLGEAEITEGMRRQQPAARRALDEALLDHERLDDLLDRVARLRQRRSNRLDADRAAAVVLRDHRDIAPVHGIETGAVDFERVQRLVGGAPVDRGHVIDQREVTHSPQQPASDARSAAGAACDLV